MRHLESTFVVVVVVPLSFVVHTDTFQLWSINGHNQIDLVVGWGSDMKSQFHVKPNFS